jgi:hypothetical protein
MPSRAAGHPAAAGVSLQQDQGQRQHRHASLMKLFHTPETSTAVVDRDRE